MKKIIFIIIILTLLSVLNARSFYSIGNGNWSDTSIWSLTSGGHPANMSPTSGDNVYIENNDIILDTDLLQPGIQLFILNGSLTENIGTDHHLIIKTGGTFSIINGTVDIYALTTKTNSQITIDSNSIVTTEAFTTNRGTMIVDGTLIVGTELENTGTISGNGTVTAGIFSGSGQIFNIIPTSSIPDGSTVSNDGILPVILSNFNAQYINNTPTVYWCTQSESNNAYWNVYRSISQNLGQATILNINPIEGTGTSSVPTEYCFIDQHQIEGGMTYWYWIECVGYDGVSDLYGPVCLTILPGINEPITPQTPTYFGLYQNFPNPFNPSTLICFAVKDACVGELSIYNVRKQKIRTLYLGNIPKDEMVSVIWDSKDESGKEVASGVYIYQLITNNKERYLRKMLLVK